MKTELLESLLCDRALGELSPEVAALLDAYLGLDPDAARRAAELTDTLQLARAVMAAPAESPRRPLDIARLRHAERAQQPSTRRWQIFRLAACLALGLALGWLARTPQPRAKIARTPAAASSSTAQAPVAQPPADSPARLWSLARLAAEHAAAAPASVPRHEKHPRVSWPAAQKFPYTEEKS